MIQIGNQPRVFMIGGGMLQFDIQSMKKCKELMATNDEEEEYNFEERHDTMYSRRAHSLCQMFNIYIVVTGSYTNDGRNKVEYYDIEDDEWFQLSQLNDGRFWHSSTNFNDKFIYIFGGNLDTMERL